MRKGRRGEEGEEGRGGGGGVGGGGKETKNQPFKKLVTIKMQSLYHPAPPLQ